MELPASLLKAKPKQREKVLSNGKAYWVNYMPAALMKQCQVNGFAYKGEVYINEALVGGVKRFVIKHEIYHLNDRRKWLGYFGLELRANAMTGLKDPIGFLMTASHSIKDARLRVYIKRLLGRNRS